MKRCEPWKETVEKLYKEMYPALHAYARRVLEDSALAEEAIQDAFCIACARRDQFLTSPNPQGWIMLTLKHVMQNTLRAQAKLKALLALDAGAEQLADFRNLFPTQRQCDVHTHMARYYNLFLHSYNTTGYSVQSRNSAGVSSSTSGNLPVSSKNRLSLESSLHWETSMTMVFPPSVQKL